MDIKTANRLAEMRKNAGLSQEELADRIGVTRQAVSKWERNESSPDTDNLIELSRLYGVTIDELINGKNPATEKKEEKSAEGDFVYKDDGITVGINDAEISVKNEYGEEKKYDAQAVGRKRAKEKRINGIVTSVFSAAAVIAYLLLGFLVKDGRGWACGWVVFPLIPVVSSIVEIAFYKRIAAFNYPCLITSVYCAIGMIFGVWHPTWIMWITIPVFYVLAGIADKATRTYDYEAIDDALDEKEERRGGTKKP